MDAIADATLVWPTPASMQSGSPASQVGDMARRIHALTGRLVGQESGYSRGTLCRLWLQLMDREFGDVVWDGFHMGDLCTWIPDVRGNCVPLAGLWGT